MTDKIFSRCYRKLPWLPNAVHSSWKNCLFQNVFYFMQVWCLLLQFFITEEGNFTLSSYDNGKVNWNQTRSKEPYLSLPLELFKTVYPIKNEIISNLYQCITSKTVIHGNDQGIFFPNCIMQMLSAMEISIMYFFWYRLDSLIYDIYNIVGIRPLIN